jgi:hypothetical protein
MRTAWCVGLGLLVMAVSLGMRAQVSVGTAQSTGTVPHWIPFSMSQTMTRVQTLANGTTITHIEVIRTMRDSQGARGRNARVIGEMRPSRVSAASGICSRAARQCRSWFRTSARKL